MIAHQKMIRNQHKDGHSVPENFSAASVREISYAEAKTVILKYEWLGTMGAARRCFGLFFNGELAGVECFGSTAGSNVSRSVCGAEYADHVITLCRGACVHWAHPHSASFLINRACRMMSKEGKNIFVAYSDRAAGEIGTVYQACGWAYCGVTSANKGVALVSPDGKEVDERVISVLVCARRRRTDRFFRRPSWSEMKAKLIADGWIVKPRTAKQRYIGIYGDKRLGRELRAALRWEVLPYPKRIQPHSPEA